MVILVYRGDALLGGRGGGVFIRGRGLLCLRVLWFRVFWGVRTK